MSGLGEAAVEAPVWNCTAAGCTAQNAVAAKIVNDLHNAINGAARLAGNPARIAPSNTFGPGSVQLLAAVFRQALPLIPQTRSDRDDMVGISVLYSAPEKITSDMIQGMLDGYADLIGMINGTMDAFTKAQASKTEQKQSVWRKYWYAFAGAGAVAVGGIAYVAVGAARRRKQER